MAYQYHQSASGRLRSDIINQIAEDVPIDCHCPYCDRDIDPDCIIDRNSKLDARQWEAMADRVIQTVVDSLPTIIKEVIK